MLTLRGLSTLSAKDVRQECVLSPRLVNMVLDKVKSRIANIPAGIKSKIKSDKRLDVLKYAGDICLLAHTAICLKSYNY